MEVVYSDVKHFKPKSQNLKFFLQESDTAVMLLTLFGSISIICCLFACFFIEINLQVFIFSSIVMFVVVIFGIAYSEDKKDNKEAIIPNEPNQKYHMCLGYEVKKFYGNAYKSSKARNNKVRPLLINAETSKRHFLCMATIGAGKTVFMKGLIEQHLILGGGMFVLEGKGTDEFAREMFGLCASVGREKDFYHINLLDMDNTHTINPLSSGTHLGIFEILTALLVGEENEWKAKQKEFMKVIIKHLIYKRDNEKDFTFNFSTLTEMMSLSTLLNEALKYKHLANKSNLIDDLVKYVTSTIMVDYHEFLQGDPKDKKWVDELKKASQNSDIQGVYDISMAIQGWRGIITNLSSDYGRVFNAMHPSISLWEATQKNKIIFVTLPTMDSDQTPREIGRLFLGIIKGVAAQKAKDAEEPIIPFMDFNDELGSYVTEGFGRLESKSRSIGISVVPFFQSPAQIDVVAKNEYERKEIIDVTGVHVLMKNMHPDTSDFYNKMIPKKVVISRDYSQRRDFSKGQGNVEDSYKSEEKDAIEHNEVINMNEGEMMVFANGKFYRAVAQAESNLLSCGKKTTYGLKTKVKLPLIECVYKKKFFTKVFETLKDEEISQMVGYKFFHEI